MINQVLRLIERFHSLTSCHLWCCSEKKKVWKLKNCQIKENNLVKRHNILSFPCLASAVPLLCLPAVTDDSAEKWEITQYPLFLGITTGRYFFNILFTSQHGQLNLEPSNLVQNAGDGGCYLQEIPIFILIHCNLDEKFQSQKVLQTACKSLNILGFVLKCDFFFLFFLSWLQVKHFF